MKISCSRVHPCDLSANCCSFQKRSKIYCAKRSDAIEKKGEIKGKKGTKALLCYNRLIRINKYTFRIKNKESDGKCS